MHSSVVRCIDEEQGNFLATGAPFAAGVELLEERAAIHSLPPVGAKEVGADSLSIDALFPSALELFRAAAKEKESRTLADGGPATRAVQRVGTLQRHEDFQRSHFGADRVAAAEKAAAALTEDQDERDFLLRVFFAANVNAFAVRRGSTLGAAVFLDASLFSHSCSPNCAFETSPPEETEGEESPAPTIRILTASELEDNTLLAISYLSDLLPPTRVRRADLLATKAFLCQCTRCGSVDEKGANTGAFRCATAGCAGAVNAPVAGGAWSCDACGSRDRTRADCEELEAKVLGHVATLQELTEASTDAPADLFGAVQLGEKMMRKYEEDSFLGEHHFALTRLRVATAKAGLALVQHSDTPAPLRATTSKTVSALVQRAVDAYKRVDPDFSVRQGLLHQLAGDAAAAAGDAATARTAYADAGRHFAIVSREANTHLATRIASLPKE